MAGGNTSCSLPFFKRGVIVICEKGWYKALLKVSDFFNAIINFCCVTLLTAQTLAIIMMVIGRYVFNKVPAWTEQFAIFCMVWFAMFSIALGVRKDSHVKVELVDTFASEKVLFGFKIFGCFMTMIFGYIMVRYGIALSQMTWKSMLSAFRVPVGLQYSSAVAGGLFMLFNGIVYCIELIAKQQCKTKEKEAK